MDAPGPRVRGQSFVPPRRDGSPAHPARRDFRTRSILSLTQTQPETEPTRRILFYSDAPYEGGAERYIEYLVSGFPPEWEVIVVAPTHHTLDPWTTRLTDDGMSVVRPAAAGAALLRGLFRTVRRRRPDLVHLNLPHTYSASFAAAAPVAKAAGARHVVSTEHLTMIDPMRLRGRLKRLCVRSVDRLITLSRSNVTDLVGRHHLSPDRIRVVMNGVPDPGPIAPERAARADARVRPANADRGTPLLVHVGALTERKGHRVLLEALAAIADRPWALACVGEGEDRDELVRLADTLGIGERVAFPGRDEDVPAVLAASDLVVLPSRLEGVPLVLLEALAAGRAAVTTNVFGIPEIYSGSEAARLVPPLDPAALATALADCLDDPARRRAMGADARRLYEARFTAAHMSRCTRDVYEEVWA